MNSVVVLYFNEDGDPPSVEPMSKDQLRQKLKENYWGSRPVFAEPGKEINTANFSGLVIIEGQIVKPRAVKVATEYDV